MKTRILKFLFILILGCPFFSNAQYETQTEKVYTKVEEMPSYPGGDKELEKYLMNMKYPEQARKNGISGKVYVSFVIDSNGQVKDEKILRGIGGGCDEVALEMVQKMPRWKPGKQGGVPVAVQYNLPVQFNLSKPK